MLIRFGCEIAITWTQPTPLICMMAVPADRLQDLVTPETAETASFVPVSTLSGRFGNLCRRLTALVGERVLRGDATIRNSGTPDPFVPDAGEGPVPPCPTRS